MHGICIIITVVRVQLNPTHVLFLISVLILLFVKRSRVNVLSPHGDLSEQCWIWGIAKLVVLILVFIAVWLHLVIVFLLVCLLEAGFSFDIVSKRVLSTEDLVSTLKMDLLLLERLSHWRVLLKNTPDVSLLNSAVIQLVTYIKQFPLILLLPLIGAWLHFTRTEQPLVLPGFGSLTVPLPDSSCRVLKNISLRFPTSTLRYYFISVASAVIKLFVTQVHTEIIYMRPGHWHYTARMSSLCESWNVFTLCIVGTEWVV